MANLCTIAWLINANTCAKGKTNYKTTTTTKLFVSKQLRCQLNTRAMYMCMYVCVVLFSVYVLVFVILSAIILCFVAITNTTMYVCNTAINQITLKCTATITMRRVYVHLPQFWWSSLCVNIFKFARKCINFLKFMISNANETHIHTHTPIQLCQLIRIFKQIVKLWSQESNKQVLLATNCSMNAKCKQMSLIAYACMYICVCVYVSAAYVDYAFMQYASNVHTIIIEYACCNYKCLYLYRHKFLYIYVCAYTKCMCVQINIICNCFIYKYVLLHTYMHLKVYLWE